MLWAGEYTLRNLVTNKDEKVHVSRIRHFQYDPARTDPVQVALRDRNEFIIESVLQHNGHINDKSQLQFLVKWLGYDDAENTWEPWKELRGNSVLHEYLRENNLARLIPKSYN